MNEPWTTRLQQRTMALYRYMRAMEYGDADTMSAVLYEAEHDRVLERMILETNEVYQIEDRTVAHVDDIETVQLMLVDMMPVLLSTPTTTSQPQPEPSFSTLSSHPTHSLHTTTTQKKERPTHIPIPQPIKKIVTSRYSWLVAVAATLLILITLPATSALADQFLALFRVQQLQPVSIDSQESIHALFTTLQNIGDLKPQQNKVNSNHQNLTQSAAEKIVGYHILLPSYLPSGVSNTRHITVTNSSTATYTFNASKAKAYLAKHGQGSVAIPAQLNGTSYTFSMASSVNVRYTACNSDKVHCQQGPAFFINEIASPSIQSNGTASITQLRDFLLSLPNLSPSTHELLRHIDERTGTIPVPIPPQASSEQITIHGVPALLLKSNNTSVVIWETQGIMYSAFLGSSDKTQLLDAVNSLA